MVNFSESQLDLVFAALSDSTRRGVLARLGDGSSTVTELAEPYGMSLPGFMKHLAVLETAGLIARSKEGRVVSCELEPAAMREAAKWISHYERFWTERLDALARHFYQQEETRPWKQPSKRRPKSPSAAPTAPPPKKSGARGPKRKR